MLITVVLIGGSTMNGTEPPLGGTVIQPGETYIRNGVVTTSLNWLDTGPQSGLLTCLYSLGYQATIIERSAPGINAAVLQDKMALALGDLVTWGLTPDYVVMSHGGNDAKVQTYATNYGNRIFGPWWELGPRSNDTSVFGQVRGIYGADPTFIVSTLPNWNGENLYLNEPATGTAYWHETVRAQQLMGCDRDINCKPVIADPNIVELATDSEHPSSLGYWNMGWEMCAAIDQTF